MFWLGIGTSIHLVSDIPGGNVVPAIPDPFVVANFITTEYSIDGIGVSLSDIVVENTAYSAFTANIDGTGLIIIDGDSPSIEPSITANVSMAEFTLFCQFNITDPVFGALTTDYMNIDTYASWWYVDCFVGASQITTIDGAVPGTNTIFTSGSQKFALRISSTTIAFCLNGGDVISVAPSDAAMIRNHLGVRGRQTLEILKIYNHPLTDDNLKVITFISNPNAMRYEGGAIMEYEDGTTMEYEVP